MATNGRPVTRIHVNYGSLGTIAESQSLNPVMIAPRYAVHSYREGYSDGFLVKYSELEFDKYSNGFAWPALEGKKEHVDVTNAKLMAGKPYIELNPNLPISGEIVTGSNKIELSVHVSGDYTTPSLGDYRVLAGDIVKIKLANGSYIYPKVTKVLQPTSSGQVIYINEAVDASEAGDVTCVFASDRYFPEFMEIDSDCYIVDNTAENPISLASTAISVTVDGVERNVLLCDLYAEYRELITEGALSLVSSGTAGVAEWAGVSDPQNPMGLMFNTAKGAGGGFLMIATDGDSEDSYIRAVEYVAQFETAYAMVPYMSTQTIRDGIIDIIDKYAKPEIAHFKRAWLGALTSQLNRVYPINLSAELNATMGDDGKVTLADAGTNLFTGGVTPGDYVVVKSNNGSANYLIKSLEDDSSLVIEDTDGFGMPPSAFKCAIHRKLSNAEYAEALAAEAAGINNARINLVWGDGVSTADCGDLPLSIACAALAAQRASLPPHAPMTDMVVPGIRVADSLKFSDAEYDTLNKGGVWVIHNNSDGDTVTYHQITTKTDGTIAEEDSCVSAGDAIIRNFRTAIKALFNGAMNVHPGLLSTVRAQLMAQAESIKSSMYPDVYGPLLLGFTVNDLYIPDSNKGSIVVNCSAELARPYAGGDFTFNLI